MNTLIYAEQLVGLINAFVIMIFGVLLLSREVEFSPAACLGLEACMDFTVSYMLYGGLSIAIMR